MSSKKIKVLRIMNRMVVGGPVHNVVYLTRFLGGDFETKLIAGIKEPDETEATELIQEYGIKVDYINKMARSMNILNDYGSIQEIRAIIRKYKPDIVHTHASKPGFVGRIAAWLEGVPVIVHTFHGHVFHSYFGKFKTWLLIVIERLLAKITTKIIAISHQQKRELVRDFEICKAAKIETLAIGFDLEKFTVNQDIKRLEFRNEHQLEPDTIAVGIIGRVTEIKNHNLFVEAIHRVVNQTNKKVIAFIVGDGELTNAIKQKCEQLGIYQSFRFLSWRSDIDVVLAGLDIVTLTSLNEGTPVTLIEAQAAGKPIASTNVGGVSDTVVENKTALLSPSNDVEAFANNLIILIENDNKRLSMSGHPEFVFEKYGYLRLVAEMENLYKKCLI
jgi:glycosyltransferase involved in cell wall biosynthesis